MWPIFAISSLTFASGKKKHLRSHCILFYSIVKFQKQKNIYTFAEGPIYLNYILHRCDLFFAISSLPFASGKKNICDHIASYELNLHCIEVWTRITSKIWKLVSNSFLFNFPVQTSLSDTKHKQIKMEFPRKSDDICIPCCARVCRFL